MMKQLDVIRFHVFNYARIFDVKLKLRTLFYFELKVFDEGVNRTTFYRFSNVCCPTAMKSLSET